MPEKGGKVQPIPGDDPVMNARHTRAMLEFSRLCHAIQVEGSEQQQAQAINDLAELGFVVQVIERQPSAA